jgi:hypothetical protein
VLATDWRETLDGVDWRTVALVLPGVAALLTSIVVLRMSKRDRRAAARRDHLKYQIEALAVIADHTSASQNARHIDGRVLAYIHVIGEKRLPLAHRWADMTLDEPKRGKGRDKPTRHEVSEEVRRVMAEVADDLKRAS